MYLNAYKCNACGFLSKSPGNHCNAPMVPVVVMDNVMAESRGEPMASPTVIVREVVIDNAKESQPWKNYR